MEILKTFCILSLFVGLTFSFCLAVQEKEMDLVQTRKAIEDVNLKFEDAFRQGDSAAIASLYTEEGILLPPNSDMIKGKQGIQAFWSAVIKMGVKDIDLTTVEILAMGNMVCEIGKYSLTIQPEGSEETMEDNGKYLVIWNKAVDGSWKLHIDIWNTSMPAQ